MDIRYILVLLFCAAAFSAFAQEAPAPGQVEIVVPAHDIARGAVIGDDDLTVKLFPALRVNESIVRDVLDAKGKETRRALRAGEILRNSDLKRPTLVAKGSTVTMTFEAPGITLTAVGRALAEGGQGDTIAVLNPSSYRQVGALVIGPGTVRVGPPGPVARNALANAARQ